VADAVLDCVTDVQLHRVFASALPVLDVVVDAYRRVQTVTQSGRA